MINDKSHIKRKNKTKRNKDNLESEDQRMINNIKVTLTAHVGSHCLALTSTYPSRQPQAGVPVALTKQCCWHRRFQHDGDAEGEGEGSHKEGRGMETKGV